MRSIYLYIIMILTAAMPIACFATGRALVIGLGEQQDKSWRKINGDNDIALVVDMLKDNGFSDITTLKNERATKAAIVEAFLKLTSRCRAGDMVYIHYSGHGQLMTDLNGDEASAASASMRLWDQSWIPYDAYMQYCDEDKGDKHLCDDEIDIILRKLRKAVGRKGQIIVVVDSCHSGDATCGDEEAIRGVDDKFVIPKVSETIKGSRIRPQWLTVSACQSYQLSTEVKVKGVSYGKLTYAIYRLGFKALLNQGSIEGRLDRFFRTLSGRPQTPLVTGHL